MLFYNIKKKLNGVSQLNFLCKIFKLECMFMRQTVFEIMNEFTQYSHNDKNTDVQSIQNLCVLGSEFLPNDQNCPFFRSWISNNLLYKVQL